MRSTRSVWIVVLAGMIGAAAPAPAAERARVLDKETFMEMEGIASPAISPDAKQIVFAREWVDQIKDQSRTNLWVYDLSTGRLRELTRGAWRDTSPVWSPDSKKLAFLSDRDGTNQIHTMFVDTGDVAQLTHLPRAASLGGLKWSPDSKTLAFSQMLPDEDPILKVELPKRPRGAEWAKAPTLVDRLSWARDGSGPVEKGYTHIFVIDALVGGTPRQLTEGKFNHTAPEWAADGRTIYFTGLRKPEAEYLRGDTEIYALDVKSGE